MNVTVDDGVRAHAPAEVREGDCPSVSVVIPMWNEARFIGACLEAILAQDYPSDLIEILVVDGGSQDRSREIVETYRRRHPQIRLLRNPTGTIPAGLNIGIRGSCGAIVARVDARTLLAPDYLSTGIRLLRTSGAGNVGGPVRAATTEFRGRVLALVTQSRFGMGGAALRYRGHESQWVDTVYLGIYPRSVLETIGLYDEELIRDQDDELNYRLRAHGGRILMSPALQTRYLNSPSVRRFARQLFLYGYWKVRVCQKHPKQMSWRHFGPPLFACALLVGTPLAFLDVRIAAMIVSLTGAYAIGSVGAAVALCRLVGWRYAPVLPMAFALLHLSWGLGFLTGCIRFLPRWFRSEPSPVTLPKLLSERRSA